MKSPNLIKLTHVLVTQVNRCRAGMATKLASSAALIPPLAPQSYPKGPQQRPSDKKHEHTQSQPEILGQCSSEQAPWTSSVRITRVSKTQTCLVSF